MRVITPSKMDPWRGRWEAGARFSNGQISAAGRHGLDLNDCETFVYTRAVPLREVYVPIGQERPTESFTCPVLRRSRNGKRVEVITPLGYRQWVDADG